MLGEMVVLLTRGPAGVDEYGNDQSMWVESEIPGCAVWPGFAVQGGDPSAEAGGNRHTTITGLTVWVPASTTVASTDRMRVRGVEWEVDAEASVWTSPFTGRTPGKQVVLRRVRG